MTDIGQILIQLQSGFEGAKDLILPASGGIGLAQITGELLVALALFRAYRMSNDSHQTGIAGVVTPVIIGGMLIAWSSTTKMVSESLGLSGGALGFKPSNTSGYGQQVIDAALVGISLLGTLSVFRGLLKWKDAGEGNHGNGGDPVWSGLWHIIGGGIAMNISAFLTMLGF